MTKVCEDVVVMADGEALAGARLAPVAGAPAFLLVTGWEETHDKYLPLARDLYALGFTSLTFDLRGLGPTSAQHDTVTRAKNMTDVLAAYDLLASHPGVDASAIAVSGTSYGGYLAALLTQRRPVRWLALRVPALYRDEDWPDPKAELGEHDLDRYRHRRLEPDQNEALAACAAFEGDVLLVASGADEIIPRLVIENYRAALTRVRSSTFRVIDGADHGLSQPEWGRTHHDIFVDWAGSMIREHRRAL